MLGWGIPIYQLNSTFSADGSSKEPVQLFLFKVGIHISCSCPLSIHLLSTNFTLCYLPPAWLISSIFTNKLVNASHR